MQSGFRERPSQGDLVSDKINIRPLIPAGLRQDGGRVSIAEIVTVVLSSLEREHILSNTV